MSLRSALHDFTNAGLGPVRFSERTATERANRAMEKLIGDVTGSMKAPEDLDTVAERVAKRLRMHQPVEMGDLHRAPWCIWHEAMGKDETLVARLLQQIEVACRRRAYRALAAAWLWRFKPDGFCVPLVGRVLAKNAEHLSYPYKEAHAAYNLFDVQTGPERIAEIALRQGVTPDEILRSVGVRENAVGYREEVYRKGLKSFREISDPVTRLETGYGMPMKYASKIFELPQLAQQSSRLATQCLERSCETAFCRSPLSFSAIRA